MICENCALQNICKIVDQMVALVNNEGIALSVTDCRYYVPIESQGAQETTQVAPKQPHYEEKVADVKGRVTTTKKQSLGEFLGG